MRHRPCPHRRRGRGHGTGRQDRRIGPGEGGCLHPGREQVGPRGEGQQHGGGLRQQAAGGAEIPPVRPHRLRVGPDGPAAGTNLRAGRGGMGRVHPAHCHGGTQRAARAVHRRKSRPPVPQPSQQDRLCHPAPREAADLRFLRPGTQGDPLLLRTLPDEPDS